jgi:hypothetical protein
MRRSIVALLLIAFMASPAEASLMRIDLTKANQATAPVKFALTTQKLHGLIVVRVALARSQAPLAHLWRVDLVVRKGKKTWVSVPIATTVDGDTLTAELVLDPAAMKGVEIWIRTGEHAPMAETVYAIDVGSFR